MFRIGNTAISKPKGSPALQGSAWIKPRKLLPCLASKLSFDSSADTARRLLLFGGVSLLSCRLYEPQPANAGLLQFPSEKLNNTYFLVS